MSKPTSGVSAARRNAEALLNKTKKRESDFKLEQQRENEALALKTARLRELRLAKEAADRSTVAHKPSAGAAPEATAIQADLTSTRGRTRNGIQAQLQPAARRP